MAVQTKLVSVPQRAKPHHSNPKAIEASQTTQPAAVAEHERPGPQNEARHNLPQGEQGAAASPTPVPVSPVPTKHIELMYHGSFAPFHLGHLAVVEAAVRLVATTMKPAVVATWISLTAEKYLLGKGELHDPVLKRYAHGPNRCTMIDAVCSTCDFRIHIIPREYATSSEMFQHVKMQTPGSFHIYLSGSDTTPKLTDQTVTVWRDPNKNLTQFSIRRLAGTAVQRTHHGISSTQIRLAIIDKDWQKVTQMCGEAGTVEARRLAATIPAKELDQDEGSQSDYYDEEEEETAPAVRPYPFAGEAAAASPPQAHTTSKAAGAQPSVAEAALQSQQTKAPVKAVVAPKPQPKKGKGEQVSTQPKQQPDAASVKPIDLVNEASPPTKQNMPPSGSSGPPTQI
eukprot:2573998-Amphidinium_carterae.2